MVPMQGVRGEAPNRISKHCSVSGLLRLGLGLGKVWVRFGLGWFGLGLG